MPSVRVISRASPFGRYHGGAQRVLRRALFTECGAIVRLFHAFQNKPADANIRLFGIDLVRLENAFGIVITKFITQFVTAFWNRTDTSPFSVAHFEHLIHELLRGAVTVALDHAPILV